MSRLTITHDKFVRAILADKRVAMDYFKSYLPYFISSQIDFSSLAQVPDTYLSKQLQKTMSDIVYSCKKINGEDVKISLLLEHKSQPEKFTPVQIGGYIFSGLQKQIENKEKLSIIIPILFYHGKQKWKYQTLAGLFGNLEPEWRQFLPDFDYVYNNLREIADEEVEAINNKFLVASLLALKHSFQKGWLENNAQRILILTDEASENLQMNLVVYLFGNSKLKEDGIKALLDPLPFKLKTKIMSTLDIFVKKGRQEGVEIGVEIGIEQTQQKIVSNLIKSSAWTDEQIASVADVTLEFVRKVRSNLNF